MSATLTNEQREFVKKAGDAYYSGNGCLIANKSELATTNNLKAVGLFDDYFYPNETTGLILTPEGRALYHELFPPSPTELAVRILTPFHDSCTYNDYRGEDGWTDTQFDDMLAALRATPNLNERQRLLVFAALSYAFSNVDELNEAFGTLNDADEDAIIVRGQTVPPAEESEYEELMKQFAPPM